MSPDGLRATLRPGSSAGLPRGARGGRAQARAQAAIPQLEISRHLVAAEHERARRRAHRLGEAGRAQARRAEHGTVRGNPTEGSTRIKTCIYGGK